MPLAKFDMRSFSHGSGSLPLKPGRLGLITRSPRRPASRALSRQ